MQIILDRQITVVPYRPEIACLCSQALLHSVVQGTYLNSQREKINPHLNINLELLQQRPLVKVTRDMNVRVGRRKEVSSGFNTSFFGYVKICMKMLPPGANVSENVSGGMTFFCIFFFSNPLRRLCKLD